MDGISLDTALLFKYFRGLTTGEERKRVEDWMQISEENEKTVLQAARIFYISQTKLLQKSEMRKEIVIELSYKGLSRASDYS